MTDAEIKATTRRIENALKEIGDVKKRKEISIEAAEFVVQAAANNAPMSSKVHYVYSTPKINKKVRAKRGSALSYRTAYYPGNLKLSIRSLTKLRRSIGAIIGPRILRRARAKSYGKSKSNTNAFYAQMIYGSAIAFRDRIMIPALQSQESKVIGYIRKEVDKITKKAAAKNKLN